MASGCPEPLERIFRQVEEESERRAEEERQRAETLEKLNGQSSALSKRVKERRRGSISISRLGQYNNEDVGPLTPLTTVTPVQTPVVTSIAAKSPFYQNQIANASTSSVASGASAFSDDNAHAEDPSQVTQITQIQPKSNSFARMIPRRLSRARSQAVIPGAAVIDVSVHETTSHSSVPANERGDSEAPSRRVSVSAQGGRTLRSQTSRSTLPGSTSPTPSSSWVGRARSFTQKFKRKSKQDGGSRSPP